MITTQADLEAALLVGGDVICDPTVTIALTDTMAVALPTRLLGGTFTIDAGPAFEVTSSDVEIGGLSIAGGIGGGFDDTQKLIYVLGTSEAPLSRVDIHDCHLSDSAADNIWVEWCVDSTVHDNIIEHYLYSGIMVISGSGLTIADNVISDATIAAGQLNCYGIALTDLDNTLAARTHNCSVVGNRINLIDWEGIDTHGGTDLVITGNVVTACHRGIALVTGNATRVTSPTNCVVSGNVVDGTGARVTPDIGVFLSGISGQPASATVTGNQVVGYDSAQPFSANFYNRGDTYIGGNSRPFMPWTAVPLATGFTGNATFPPMYMVDGNTVSFRGGVVPPAGGMPANPQIGTLASAAWPEHRTFYATTKSSNAAGGIGTLNVDIDGKFRVDYASTSDTFTWWLTGSYQAI